MKQLVGLLSVWILALAFMSQKTYSQDYKDEYWRIQSELTCNGTIEIEMEVSRWIGLWQGLPTANFLYLQYQDVNFGWQTIARIYRNPNDGVYPIIDNTGNGFVRMDSRRTVCWACEQTFYTITFQCPYPSMYNSPIQFRVMDGTVQKGQRSATAFLMKPPTNFTASTNECNQVTLSWDPPQNIGAYTVNYDIWKNGIKIIVLDGTQTDWTDTNVVDGEDYTYSIQCWVHNCGVFGLFTENKTGHSLPHLGPPINLSGSEDDCGSRINLSWEYSGISPPGFQIQRATDAAFANIVQEENIGGSQRSYANENLTKGVTYHYRIRTKNSCNEYGDWSTGTTGKAPDLPPAPSNIQLTSSGNQLTISWAYTPSTETGFSLLRTDLASGAVVTTQIDKTKRVYLDQNAGLCTVYRYEIKAVNPCGSSSGGTVEGFLEPNLGQSFDAGALQASKGYYNDHVSLTWYTADAHLLDHFKITRKIMGSNESAVVATLDKNQENWHDFSTVAGVMYAYSIKGIGLCNDQEVTTNIVSDIGFKTATGVITGNVSYEGGVAVQGAQVLVNRTSGTTGSSVLFNGTTSYGIANGNGRLNPETGISIEVWIKPTTINQDFTIINKTQGNSGYRLNYDAANSLLVFSVGNGATWGSAFFAGSIQASVFQQITATYDGTFICLFLDGILKHKVAWAAGIVGNTADFILGANHYFPGFIDEIRIWDKGLTEVEVGLNWDRILNGAEEGLMGYWRADENIGDRLFDASKQGHTWNENHIILTDCNWSNSIPSDSQLGLKGVSDSNGNYIINNIRYTGAGDNFTLTPFFGQHSFDPSSRSLFIGEGAAVHNNQDFKDNSSFEITGFVNYEGTNCPVKGVYLYIDGVMVVKNGSPVVTDMLGKYTISVPIGNHIISVGKQGHTFVNATFPNDGSSFNFQEHFPGNLNFVDNTSIMVVGRVVGGTREGDKKPGMGLSINNIGQAEIIFSSQLGNGCSTKSIETDLETGEYKIELLPLKYTISSLNIDSNPEIAFLNLPVLDLSNNPMLQTVYDTVYQPDSEVIDHIDSAKFHVRSDYIHRVGPELSITNVDGSVFRGDQEALFVSLKGDTTRVDLTIHPFPWPVFSLGTNYLAKISVFEKYVNKDTGEEVQDLVPVTDGNVKINNGLSTREGEVQMALSSADGFVFYPFQGGFPNPNKHNLFSEYDYTKIMQVSVETGTNGSITTIWEPNAHDPGPDGDKHFRAYVLGSRPKGNNFTTVGPQMVDFILRDPPGSNSYAYLEKDSSFTTTESWTSNFGESYSVSTKILLGVEFGVGGGLAGPLITQQSMNNIDIGLKVDRTTTESGELVTEYSFTQTMSTADDDNYVGRDADLFMGQSRNIVYGLTDNIEILPDTINSAAIETTGGSVDGFRISKRTGMFADPTGFATFFIYSQVHIEEEMIPGLINLRNNLIANNGSYSSALAADHPNYGSNNDDPVWGANVTSADFVKTDLADYSGLSYTFSYAGSPPPMDSVRWYNQQIRLWKDALARNEKEKLQAQLIKNVSFDAGAKLEEKQSFSRDSSHTAGWEVQIDQSVAVTIGAKAFGLGFENNLGLAFNQTEGQSKGTSVKQSTTIGYVLDDPDEGDFFSVDIMKPNTPGGLIFKTKGGKSRCPFEDKSETEYYQPGTVISEATLQREKPKIDVAPANLYSVPEDEAAEFLITMTNESQSDDPIWYTAQVVEGSNPHGAIIQIDGESPNRTFYIPGGASITKRLTVKKGAVGISEYDDLKLLLKSSCQYQIADTCVFSVHFVASCTDINIISPADQWVANYANDNSMKITVGGYNINNDLFEKFEIQYKPKNGQDWYTLASYYKDLTGITDPNAKLITVADPTVSYDWDLSEVVDGAYQIRATTTCPMAGEISDILTGIIDRVNPHPFGTPQPADGVLQPNDEILIQFNEDINGGLLNYFNFDIRGVLNGTAVSHGTSLYFDGTSDHYVNVPEGISLQNKSFTLEIWAKRSSLGEMCMVSQGTAHVQGVAMGFDALNQFFFSFAGHTVHTDETWVDLDWHHWVVSHNYETGDVQLFVDGSLYKVGVIPAKYKGSGKIQLGKRSFGADIPFNGNLHEFRIWNTFRTQAKIVENMNTQLNGLEQGLIGNWRMDEAFGELAEDLVHFRNANIHANWSIHPASKAFGFNGVDGYLEMPGGLLTCTIENDLTIEFWVKGNTQGEIGILSNGTGKIDGSPSGWAIKTDAAGNILVFNQGLTFLAADLTIWDNTWQHVAIVVSRLGNISSFVNGNMQYAQTSSGWGEFGGAKLWAGCLGWMDNIGTAHQNLFFSGKLDEIRVWRTARKQEQIQRDMNHRLGGDEQGLLAYYPFEAYVDNMGAMLLETSLNNQAKGSVELAAGHNGAAFSDDTPNIKLKRPVQSVNFNFSYNEDKIILTPTDPAGLIENTILDISVKDVQDLYQNALQSPVTWTAFVDRNQVKWEDERIIHEKLLYDPLSFSATIVNSGGNQQAFSIDNLPNWLTAVPQSGTLQPVSTQVIQFVVSEAVPIGHYSFDAYLHTNFNFDEKLLIDLRVYKEGPDWLTDPSGFEYTMNVVGQLSIDGILSNDIHDRVAAFINGQCRGVSNLQYIAAYDLYEVYLDIYSSNPLGEEIELRVWNASEGVVHTEVTPDLQFVHNKVYGLPANPISIEALNTYEQTIPLRKGWNWTSFNLITPDLGNPNTILKDLEAVSGSMVKGQQKFDAYSVSNGWVGTITFGGGFQHEEMYKIYHPKADSIIYTGSRLTPSLTPINLNANWNWVGFTPNSPMPLEQALGYYNAKDGDLIKSQAGFSMYDNNLGWIGSLTSMQPNQGYMMKVTQAASFYYPDDIVFGIPMVPGNALKSGQSEIDPSDFQFNMSVIAEILADDPIPGQHLTLKAWSGSELRGIIDPVWDESRSKWLYYLTIYGFENPESIKLTALDNRTGDHFAVSESVVYAPDLIQGSYREPLELHLAGNISGAADLLIQPFDLKSYPNPFTQELTIEYILPDASWVRIEVFDALGQKVAILEELHKAAGAYKLSWNGHDQFGSPLAQGMYTLRIQSDQVSANTLLIKTKSY